MALQTHSLEALRINRAAPPRRKLPILLVLAVVGGLAAAVGLIWWSNRTPAISVRTVVVQAATTSGGGGGGGVVSGGERTLLNASGYVTARREATVSSKVTGKVVEVLIEEGMKVEAGQVLARLDSSNVEVSLQLAKAQMEAARDALGETQANLEQAQRELERIGRLAAKEAATPLELERAETSFKSLAARLTRQRADLEVGQREVAVWEQQLDDTIIRAPFAGIVTTKNAQPGEMISPMSVGGFTRTGICTIVDMSSLEIEVDVSESYINRVKPGQPVLATLDSYPDWRIPASVIAIIPTADRQKATVKVRVGFKQLDPRILPDMSVKVAFQSAGEENGQNAVGAASLSIPKAAVRQANGRDIVWVVREGRVERRAVTIGGTSGDQAIIAAGVAVGERVVVDGPDNLTDGARVTEERQE
ncbi:MAG: efflux RND transporter periplasmic adaptor subunit [Phycisphaerales bacterium]|nr:efflux RND transporter periplasmic adaptor subunit [Phycisphaerales bacterium]MCI0631667.1 efflux RND transporter periplasmic adaptor subunit [Phycisphaerales bacterium]MCI0677035.1 efflux RND transporter periplasmic adaptor subunit [Phycisphaerales bacterium]